MKDLVEKISKETGCSIKELNRLNQNKWYHGTTIEGAQNIKKIGVLSNYNMGTELDFGMGFYLMDSYDRAERYISSIPIVQKDNTLKYPTEWAVIEFQINPFLLIFCEDNHYTYKNLPRYDEEFARFSLHNRLYNVYNECPHGYDIIWGVMSDSVPTRIVSDVKTGVMSFEEAVTKMQKHSSMKQLYIGKQEICDKLIISNIYVRKEEKNEN